ncbi:porin [Psychromonas sp. KJ10-10]|uniref:porin n=1 Tax=Psychromonas sp. KJ10-10 TaxID=3391823 RepID=UPI0039B69963
MRKTLLATAILSGLVSTAGATTVYDNDGTSLKVGGRAEARGLFSDSVDGTMEDKSRARINFSGKTKISEDLSGFGYMEYELQPSTKDGSDLDNRYLFAGLSTNVGDFSYGKQDTANIQVSGLTDIASAHSGQQEYIDSASSKAENTFLYSGTLSEALTLQFDYQAVEDKDMDALSVSALYAFDSGLELATSYADQDEADQITFGVAYTLDDLYLATTYAMGAVDATTDFTSLEATIQYKFTKEFRMIGIVGIAEEEVGSVSSDTEDFYALEAQYRFNKSLRTYASYKFNNLDATSEEDELIVGLRYNF